MSHTQGASPLHHVVRLGRSWPTLKWVAAARRGTSYVDRLRPCRAMGKESSWPLHLTVAARSVPTPAAMMEIVKDN